MRLPATLGVLLALVFAAKSVSAACSLPADVSNRIGRAQAFVSDWSRAQYEKSLRRRDYVWSNAPGSRQGYDLRLPHGTFSSAYVALDRVPTYPEPYGRKIVTIAACGRPAGGCPLSWFQTRHPDWIVLKHDRATPAYEFGDRSWVPLDIANPAVRVWLLANEIAPILSAGYQGISVDNVTDRNDFDAEGVCSVAVASGDCASNGGKWTRLYSGAALGDRHYIAGRLAWLRTLASAVHQRNACLSENVTYDPANTAATAALIATADIWYDEDGFTGDSSPSACSPRGGGSGSVGAAWIRKFGFVTGLNRGAGVPNVQENSICPLGDPATRRVLDYAIASYLLTKNAHTYFLAYFDGGKGGGPADFTDDAPGGMWPELGWVHGPAQQKATAVNGVYRRTFANGMALLNPSTRSTASYDLGAQTYHSFDGRRYTGKAALPPTTGLVLIDGAPPGGASPH